MNEAAVNDALGELLSPSQANTYLACPAKWYFRYLRKYPTTDSHQLCHLREIDNCLLFNQLRFSVTNCGQSVAVSVLQQALIIERRLLTV